MRLPLVLVYHHVLPEPEGPWAVSPEELDRQVEALLRRGFELTTPGRWFRAPCRRRSQAILTFDDGYADAFEHARPVLESRGVPGSVFLIAEAIGRESDWDHPGIQRHRHLSRGEIDALCQRGWEAHSHTARHAELRTLSDREIEDDVRRATETLRRFNTGPLFCAWPYGRSEPRMEREIRRAGYAGAYLARPEGPGGGAFRLPRVEGRGGLA